MPLIFLSFSHRSTVCVTLLRDKSMSYAKKRMVFIKGGGKEEIGGLLS